MSICKTENCQKYVNGFPYVEIYCNECLEQFKNDAIDLILYYTTIGHSYNCAKNMTDNFTLKCSCNKEEKIFYEKI